MVAVLASTTADAVATNVVNVTPATPAGGIGDLLLAFCSTTTTNTTWTGTGFGSEGNNVGVGSSAVLSRIADGSEGATLTLTRAVSVTGVGVVTVARYLAGTFDPADPVDAVSFGVASGATSIVLDSQSPTGTDNLLAQFVNRLNGTADAWTPPGTATERADAASAGVGARYAVGDEIVGAGATGTRTWTYGVSGQSRGALVSINPAAASANPGSIKAVYNANNTFTVPPGVTSITVECEGGGGGGGVGSALFGGGGGGGGAYASSVLAATPGGTHSVVIGAQVAGSVAGNLSSFGTGPLVRGAGGGVGGAGGPASGGTAGPGGTVANSIGTTRTAGSNGAAGGAANGGGGGAGASPLGGAGGAVNGGAGTAPGGGGGGGAVLSGAGGTGAKGQVTVRWDTADVIGEGIGTHIKAGTKTLNAVGEGLGSSTKLAVASKTFDLAGEGLTSRTLAVALERSPVGEGLTSMTRAVVAAKTLEVVGEGLASRDALVIVLSRSAVGEGEVSSTKFADVSKTFTVTGEGLITELHPVQAFRTFNLVGDGELLMSGPNGSTITLPLDELPDGGAGTTIRPIFVFDD